MKKILICALALLTSVANAQILSTASLVFEDFIPERGPSLQAGNPGKSFSTGYHCYDGDISVQPVNAQTIYRLQGYKVPKSNVHQFRISAYHLTGKYIVQNPTERTPEVGEPREVTCKGKIVESVYKGHESTLKFTVIAQKDEVLPTFDVMLGEEVKDLEKLQQLYSPIFRTIGATAISRFADIPFFGGDGYKGIDNTDPVAIVMAAMKIAEEMGVKRASILPVITLTDSL